MHTAPITKKDGAPKEKRNAIMNEYSFLNVIRTKEIQA
jgi:hypothetical protein